MYDAFLRSDLRRAQQRTQSAISIAICIICGIPRNCPARGVIYSGPFEKEASTNPAMHQAGGMQPTSHIVRGLGFGLFHQLSGTDQAAEL